jgi:hypothetical protein
VCGTLEYLPGAKPGVKDEMGGSASVKCYALSPA